MARTIGLADTTAKTIANRPPRLLIIAGATGTGKSTVSMKIAAKSNFARLISTDAIREILRSTDDLQTNPALHRSSFSIGDSNDAIIDWIDTCQAVEKGIEATINRAMREGIDLLLEGVHIIPSDRLIRNWIDSGGIAVGVIMAVSDEEKHKSMIKSRDAHSFRRHDRYIANFERIRRIQDGLIERSKISSWPVVDISRVSSDLEKIEHHLDVAWNQNRS
ncbi:MAG: zeta toxin family protein [Candidatus Thermoplasmatota archaeon]|nr:zeta toxin family protein [Candidatus Thermoplasmatota archaeon]